MYYLQGDFFDFFFYVLLFQHCFICCPYKEKKEVYPFPPRIYSNYELSMGGLAQFEDEMSSILWAMGYSSLGVGFILLVYSLFSPN